MPKAKPEPSFERFLKVLRRQGEPDRVPFAELFHDYEIMTAIQGPPEGAGDDLDRVTAWWVKFWYDHGYDYCSQRVDFGFTREGLAAEDTARLSRGQRTWVDEAKGPITNWQEFEAYTWPEVTPACFRTMEATARHLPEGMKIIAMLPGGPMENITFLMGFETFSYALMDQPDLIAAITEKIAEILIKVVEHTCSMEAVGAQWINDDMGFKGGTLCAPSVLREYVFPTQKHICEIIHAAGKPVLLHSCGKLDQIMDELIVEVGIDAKHSFEDVIMPVWEVKRLWGSRLALLGGVDMDILCRGTEDQVRIYTRTCIERCAPGGGWALGSGNTVANYMPIPNFLAMLDEGCRAGVY